MVVQALDDRKIRSYPLEERIKILEDVFKNSSDESLRWDAVWLAGEIPEQVGLEGPLYQKVSDLFAWVLKNDDNSVVRHEVCYQISGRNMRERIPDLVEAGLHDESALVRHEAIECLGIIRAFEQIDAIKQSLSDPSEHVRITAKMVLKRMERYQGRKFVPEEEYIAY